MKAAFVGNMLRRIATRGRALISAPCRDLVRDQPKNLVDLCQQLLSIRGEASGVTLAKDILLQFAELPPDDRLTFFAALATTFGHNRSKIDSVIDSGRTLSSDQFALKLHQVTESSRLELFRRLNAAPHATVALVRMREQLIDVTAQNRDLSVVDGDFVHLFSSWFNRGFLVLRRIDWSTSAAVLEKIIRYEAVHAIQDWSELRRRIEPADRRCYAFFHPALVDEPLIFVEVALMSDMPGAIAPILSEKRDPIDPRRATTAVFYSITNCQRGLAGVSFGNFLLKQVIEDISRELPKISTFVTLSPAPNFAAWLKRERSNEASVALDARERAALSALDSDGWWRSEEITTRLEDPLIKGAAWYYLRARNDRGMPADPVARFHLGNGARLERLNWLADPSERGLKQSHGLMVNYLYDLKYLEHNHEAYAEQGKLAASSALNKMITAPVRDVAVLRKP